MERNKTIERNVFLGLSLCVLFIVGIYNLTHASLWYDETIEFFYSKYIDGPVHDGGRGTTDMYDRITSTFQPPLYNVVMYFWLKVSTSEWWFRFFGVVMGVVGGVGIFKAVEKTWNYKAASAAVIMLAFTLRYIYYMQEAAEYTVLLASLGWLVYTWVRMIENTTAKNIFCYLVVACLAMYSQYGAAFPVMAFSLVAYVTILLRKNKVETRRITIGYVCAAVVAGLPLWLFFIKKQIEDQQEAMTEFFRYSSHGVLYDAVKCVYKIIGWNFYSNNKILMLCVVAVIVIATIYALLRTKNNWVKPSVFAVILCWGMFFIAEEMHMYGYGRFDGRYSLFFLPVVFPMAFCIMGEAVTVFFQKHPISKKERIVIFHIIPILLLVVWCIRGWRSISPNWQKEDIRGVVNKWYEVNGFETNTLVYSTSALGFDYYVTRNKQYGERTLENITIVPFLRGKTKEEMEGCLNSLSIQCDETYLITSHIVKKEELDGIIDYLTERGFMMKDIYDNSGARLIYFSR